MSYDPLVAVITTNYEPKPVFHLCWNCPELNKIINPVEWEGEEPFRELCEICCQRITDGICDPTLRPD